MNEFIVWDKTSNLFREVVEINYENHDRSIRNVKVNNGKRLWSQDNEFELLRDVGITYINNKKIYADSSIVELQIDEDFSNDHFTSIEPHKFIGVVRFDYLGARVEDISDKTTVWFYEIENNEIDIKIIDTVQENKLGLIK